MRGERSVVPERAARMPASASGSHGTGSVRCGKKHTVAASAEGCGGMRRECRLLVSDLSALVLRSTAVRPYGVSGVVSSVGGSVGSGVGASVGASVGGSVGSGVDGCVDGSVVGSSFFTMCAISLLRRSYLE